MDRWGPIKVQIDHFRRYLATDFPTIDIVAGYDFTWSQDQYKESRKHSPYQCCGVYLFFNGTAELLYVGKALWTFDKRIWTHQIENARYIDFICFDDEHAPFALALEHFLICRLKPKFNSHGIGYEVPQRNSGISVV
jgi:hypothetical protein